MPSTTNKNHLNIDNSKGYKYSFIANSDNEPELSIKNKNSYKDSDNTAYYEEKIN